jgi:hypothetical protein
MTTRREILASAASIIPIAEGKLLVTLDEIEVKPEPPVEPPIEPAPGYFSVDTYGAKGDGKTDDRSAIMKACAAAAIATPKGIVWFTAGQIYRVVQTRFGTSTDSSLGVLDLGSALSGITLASDPNNRARIKLRDDPPKSGSMSELYTPLVTLRKSRDITIRDIILDGSRAAYANAAFSGQENGGMHVISVVGGSGHKILGKVTLTDAHADAIYIREQGSLTVDGEDSKVRLEHSRRNGVSPVNCRSLIMRRFVIENTGFDIGSNKGQPPRSALDIEPNSNNISTDILLEDFEIIAAQSRGLMLDIRTKGRGCKNIVFRRGIIRGIGTEPVRVRTTGDNAGLISAITFEDIDTSGADGDWLIGGIEAGRPGDGKYGAANNLTIQRARLKPGRKIALRHTDGTGWRITGNTGDVERTNVKLTNSEVE